MRIGKPIIYANIAALGLNVIIIALIVAKSFPPILGIGLVVGFLAGSVWLSCKVSGRLS